MITAGVVISATPSLASIPAPIASSSRKRPDRHRSGHAQQHAATFVVRKLTPQSEPLPISISIGTHPFEITGSGFQRRSASTRWRSPADCAASRWRWRPARPSTCPTSPTPRSCSAPKCCRPDGPGRKRRFSEFTRLMGEDCTGRSAGAHQGDRDARRTRSTTICTCRGSNTWLAAPTRYATIRQALRTAGVQVKDINVTLGGCANTGTVISIKKQPGEGKSKACSPRSR